MKGITKTNALRILRKACADRGYARGYRKDVVVSRGEGLDGGNDFLKMDEAAAEVAAEFPDIEADVYVYEPGDDGELIDNVTLQFGPDSATSRRYDWRTETTFHDLYHYE